ncbi:SDR family NAD(P)-dependent oxidoreductase [Aspergillus niger CBS 101883]|uniref:Glucose 1-dehydrogenase n=1 Tax=Aspergillus niger ATCC 13496 TaxID=1353008 RepID=A0A370BSQ5_ASPNG|nr:glucose 1-dehydrogenase [Aspergillus niger CBS 513.88]XP_025448488.1 glucose 1-dehydrogenase [Aspergillus niger CBS 101883]PYH50433.1 glucose 1-dehydrogenase [Aspergillus niger CBS 101883]RDH16151.1 glucose 1-dehydrogenase [Aspergillus niger ATCC 13496]|eukprot:XP_001391092.2 glucose 1-dehydrogenase [Aspergillus niger CBS 513.88]
MGKADIPLSLHDKVALVTGGGSGIGFAAALSLAQAGAKVVIADINETRGKASTLKISQLAHNVHFVPVGVSQSASVREMIDTTVRVYGRLDIAVNNAGIGPDSVAIANLDEGSWDRLIATNLTGVALCLKWELQQIIAQAYAATKHGILGLTRVAALENGKHGIRVNALTPGGIETELTSAYVKDPRFTAEMNARTSVFGRFAQPCEIAQVVVWLASESSSYITGSQYQLMVALGWPDNCEDSSWSHALVNSVAEPTGRSWDDG